MRRLLLFLLIVIVLGAVAIWQCPASIAIPYLWRSANVSLEDISGTIWNGHAGMLSLRGRPLGAIDWQLHLQPLLQRRRNADFVIKAENLTAQGNYDRAGADTDFRNLSFRAPAALAVELAHVPNLLVGGDVEGTLPHIAVRGGSFAEVQGELLWHNATLTAPQAITLGEAHITFGTTEPGAYAGSVQLAHDAMKFSANFVAKGGMAESEWRDVKFHLPAQLALSPLLPAEAELTGDVDGALARVVVSAGALATIEGDLAWHNAAMVKPQALELGEARVKLTPAAEKNTLAGSAQVSHDALKFNGNFIARDAFAESTWRDVQFHVPAQFALVALHVTDLALSGDVDGTIPQVQLRKFLPTDIQGKMTWHDAAVTGAAQARFGDVAIDFSKAADGSITGSVNGSDGALKADGTFKVLQTQPSIQADWHNLRFTFPAQLATPLIRVPGILPAGSIEGSVTQMQWREHWPKQLQGKINWRSAELAGAARASLGDIAVEFSTVADGSVIGVLNDSGGALKVDGTFKLTPVDYDVEMILAARSANPQITAALHRVGTQQPDGSSVLKTQGKTAGLFK
ncbi:MAG: type II secretion system protein N [Rudaea sp.]